MIGTARSQGAPNLTKLFHVKHFGKVEAEHLTRAKIAASSSCCKIEQFGGTIERIKAEPDLQPSALLKD